MIRTRDPHAGMLCWRPCGKVSRRQSCPRATIRTSASLVFSAGAEASPLDGGESSSLATLPPWPRSARTARSYRCGCGMRKTHCVSTFVLSRQAEPVAGTWRRSWCPAQLKRLGESGRSDAQSGPPFRWLSGPGSGKPCSMRAAWVLEVIPAREYRSERRAQQRHACGSNSNMPIRGACRRLLDLLHQEQRNDHWRNRCHPAGSFQRLYFTAESTTSLEFPGRRRGSFFVWREPSRRRVIPAPWR